MALRLIGIGTGVRFHGIGAQKETTKICNNGIGNLGQYLKQNLNHASLNSNPLHETSSYYVNNCFIGLFFKRSMRQCVIDSHGSMKCWSRQQKSNWFQCCLQLHYILLNNQPSIRLFLEIDFNFFILNFFISIKGNCNFEVQMPLFVVLFLKINQLSINGKISLINWTWTLQPTVSLKSLTRSIAYLYSSIRYTFIVRHLS